MAIKRGKSIADNLTGTSLADQLFGLGGNDILNGLAGNDLLDGGTGTDRMSGGTGNDTYVVDRSTDRVIESAGQGTDTVRSSVSLTVGANVEHLILTGSGNINGTLSSAANEIGNSITGNNSANTLNGGLGHDVLIGGRGSDRLNGGNGNDTLLPGAGNGVADTINGGDGFDTVDYRDALGAVSVTFGGSSGGLAAAGDTFVSVENVIGSRFADDLRASAADFSFAFGGAGNDVINGSSALYDRMRGDDGYDTLFGAAGEEDFWLQYDRGMDSLISYRDSGQDHILVLKSEFGLATAAGNAIAAAEFGTRSFGSAPAFSATERLVYDTVSKILWADKDGSGDAFAPVPIASFGLFSAAPTTADIFVF